MPEFYRELNGMRLLLVEGESWTRYSLSLFFRNGRCSPHVAKCAAEGIAALSAGRFDLIICGYWLSDMDGLSFLTVPPPKVRQVLRGAIIPERDRRGPEIPLLLPCRRGRAERHLNKISNRFIFPIGWHVSSFGTRELELKTPSTVALQVPDPWRGN